jgi:hypothetical protein
MRDDHLDRFHSQENIQSGDIVSISDEEELENLCLDLIRADDIAGMRALAMTHTITGQTMESIYESVGNFASPEMLPILKTLTGKSIPWFTHVGIFNGPQF